MYKSQGQYIVTPHHRTNNIAVRKYIKSFTATDISVLSGNLIDITRPDHVQCHMNTIGYLIFPSHDTDVALTSSPFV